MAALIVMVGHAVIASNKQLAGNEATTHISSTHGSFAWFLTRTPFQVVMAGSEMVLIFFVLSGYVLALPAVVRGASWFDFSYYPRRLARLYIPAWVALAFGACVHELHRHPIRGASWFLNAHTAAPTVGAGLRNATLLVQADTAAFTTVIWSLRDEVIFSLLLPLILAVLLFARRSGKLSAFLALVCFVSMVIAADHHQDLRYMPLFVLGSLMAFNIDRLPRSLPRFAFPFACLAAIALLTTSYTISNQSSGPATGLPYLCNTLGSCMVVWIAVVSPQARHLLTRRPILWLGSRSYSLYLIHEPIVVAFAFLLHGHHTLLLLLISMPVSLLVADVFWRTVESPSVRIARFVGRYAAGFRTTGWRHAASSPAG